MSTLRYLRATHAMHSRSAYACAYRALSATRSHDTPAPQLSPAAAIAVACLYRGAAASLLARGALAANAVATGRRVRSPRKGGPKAKQLATSARLIDSRSVPRRRAAAGCRLQGGKHKARRAESGCTHRPQFEWRRHTAMDGGETFPPVLAATPAAWNVSCLRFDRPCLSPYGADPLPLYGRHGTQAAERRERHR